jgi:hypothetical protein
MKKEHEMERSPSEIVRNKELMRHGRRVQNERLFTL